MLGALLAWTPACTSHPVPLESSEAGAPTWSEVAPDLARCVSCHDRSGLAFPLTTWREAAPQADRIAAAVAEGRMPPWPAGPADVEYLDDPTLTTHQVDRIVAWAAAGAPLGDADPDEPLVAAIAGTLPRVDAVLAMAEPYAPSAGEEHRCFVLDRSAVTEPYLTGVRVIPGNPAAAHHLMLTAILPEVAGDDPLSADAADPGPGFDCGVITLAAFPGDYEVLGGWLPGRGPAVFPDGTGIPLHPDAQIVLEAHYAAPPGAAPDLTTVELMTATELRAPAVEMKITHPLWSLHQAIAVEANDAAIQGLITTVGNEAGDTIPLDQGLLGYWVLPHMHTLGVSISLEVVRGGVPTVLVDVPAWDYDWQLTYWFAEPVVLRADDELRMVCRFENPTDEDVWWGESTADEMCVARMLVAPP